MKSNQRWRYQRNADHTESQIRLATDTQQLLKQDIDGKPWEVDLVFEASSFEEAKTLMEKVLDNPYESLEDKKLKELAKLGESVLHAALYDVARTYYTKPKSLEPKALANALASELDSPFEDVQATPLFLALIRDWQEMQ